MSFIFMFIKFLLFTSPINSCFDNFCRVTCHNTVGRYIFSHYRVCSYHRIIAYGYSFQNHGTVAYPYVVPDDNRLRRPVGNVFYIVTIIVPDDSFTCDMGVLPIMICLAQVMVTFSLMKPPFRISLPECVIHILEFSFM